MVFATLLKLNAGALVIGTDPFFNTRSEQLAALAIRHAVPTIYQVRAFGPADGLTKETSWPKYCPNEQTIDALVVEKKP